MKLIFRLITKFTLSTLVILALGSAPVLAGTLDPAVVLSPDKTVQPYTTNSFDLYLVNMGVPLKRIEIDVRINGDMDYSKGISISFPNVIQYGLAYNSHYFKPFANRSDIQDLVVVFDATDAQGYNQGSAKIPLAQLSYTTVPGTLAATVIPENTKLTDINGNLVPLYTYGSFNYTTNSFQGPDIQTYSLSFETDPIRKWWPTYPNTVQQIDAALWKDSDGDNVKNFTALIADWQVDSNYLEITNTTSSYLPVCPLVTVSSRPCIHFAAHVKTKKTGKSAVTLRLTDTKTGRQAWNSYPLEIYQLNETSPSPSQSPQLVSFVPENHVTEAEFKEVQQQVTYLQTKLDAQQSELTKTQSTLNKIIAFLKRLFHFN